MLAVLLEVYRRIYDIRIGRIILQILLLLLLLKLIQMVLIYCGYVLFIPFAVLYDFDNFSCE